MRMVNERNHWNLKFVQFKNHWEWKILPIKNYNTSDVEKCYQEWKITGSFKVKQKYKKLFS